MPKFEVVLERVVPEKTNPFFNPFRAGIGNGTIGVLTRTWEFEAESQDDARRFLEEARAQDLSSVRGYSLRSLRELPPPSKNEAMFSLPIYDPDR